MKTLKRTFTIIVILLFWFTLLPNISFADEGGDLNVDWFNILPELTSTGVDEVNKKIEEIWEKWWEVWKKYNETASWFKTTEQIASWVMNRNTIMDYLVFIVQFLSQLWLVVWTVFIMYAWYKYMISIIYWKWSPSGTLSNAIIWVIIVIFSYAIMKTLTSLIWIS